MTIFWWRSEAMKQYAQGYLIAEAPDADTARAMILSMARMTFVERHSHGNTIMLDLDNDRDDLKTFKKLLVEDMTKPPRTSAVLFINGSE